MPVRDRLPHRPALRVASASGGVGVRCRPDSLPTVLHACGPSGTPASIPCAECHLAFHSRRSAAKTFVDRNLLVAERSAMRMCVCIDRPRVPIPASSRTRLACDGAVPHAAFCFGLATATKSSLSWRCFRINGPHYGAGDIAQSETDYRDRQTALPAEISRDL